MASLGSSYHTRGRMIRHHTRGRVTEPGTHAGWGTVFPGHLHDDLQLPVLTVFPGHLHDDLLLPALTMLPGHLRDDLGNEWQRLMQMGGGGEMKHAASLAMACPLRHGPDHLVVGLTT